MTLQLVTITNLSERLSLICLLSRYLPASVANDDSAISELPERQREGSRTGDTWRLRGDSIGNETLNNWRSDVSLGKQDKQVFFRKRHCHNRWWRRTVNDQCVIVASVDEASDAAVFTETQFHHRQRWRTINERHIISEPVMIASAFRFQQQIFSNSSISRHCYRHCCRHLNGRPIIL